MISVIIPQKCEPRILEVLENLDKFMPDCQIIVSTDRAGRGKGWALREGYREAKGDIICFLDGDMDIHPFDLVRMITMLENRKADIIVGAKKIEGARLSRKIISLCSKLFIFIVFGLKVDTQTGIKVFRKEALETWNDNSFAFDLEILYRAKQKGCKIRQMFVHVDLTKKMPTRSIIIFIKRALQIRWDFLMNTQVGVE